MMRYVAAVDANTGAFVYGGWSNPDDSNPYDVEPGLSPGQIRVVCDREPDGDQPGHGGTERYSGNSDHPIRPSTSEELAAHASAQERTVPIAAIVDAMTLEERANWRAAARTNDQIDDDRERFFAQPTINVNSPRVAAALTRLIGAGVIEVERGPEIVRDALAGVVRQ